MHLLPVHLHAEDRREMIVGGGGLKSVSATWHARVHSISLQCAPEGLLTGIKPRAFMAEICSAVVVKPSTCTHV